MCWNANVSLNTYIFGLFATMFGYLNNKITFTGLLFTQTWLSMQLIEYFIWNKTFSNRTLSQIAFVFVACQPLFGILSISNSISNANFIKYGVLVSYACFAIITMTTHPWSKIDFTSTPAANGHLAWNWLKYPNTSLLIWFMFLSIKFIVNKEWFILSLVTVSAALTYSLYHKTFTWGSLWCWACNFVSFMIIIDVFYDDICLYYKWINDQCCAQMYYLKGI